MDLSRRLNHESLVRRKREALSSEPSEGPDIYTIRFQLPKSNKITRRFHKTDTVQTITDFLTVYFSDSGSNVKNFSMSTHSKQELTDASATLENVVS
jgi:hypothetical protein